MEEKEVYRKVAMEVAHALKIDVENIDPESFLIGDLGAESLDLVDMTFRMEKTFEIEIPENELFEGSDPPPENLKIKDVVQYLHSRLS
jgi:acyl carrier protein